MGAPNTLKNAFFNHFFRNTAQTPAAALYLAALTAVTSESAGTVTEVATGSYARQAIAFTSPSSGATENTAGISFPVATANWGTITHYGIYDASTSGNLLFIVALGTSRTINNTEQLVLAAGDVDLTAT